VVLHLLRNLLRTYIGDLGVVGLKTHLPRRFLHLHAGSHGSQDVAPAVSGSVRSLSPMRARSTALRPVLYGGVGLRLHVLLTSGLRLLTILPGMFLQTTLLSCL
jgi:hypothetical protein